MIDKREIKIFEKCGSYCIDKEKARDLYILLKASILMDRIVKRIDLDFAHVTLMSSEFMFEFIGRLLKDFEASRLLSIINIINCKKTMKDSIFFTIEHYDRYFNDEEYKKKIDKAFGTNNKKKEENDATTKESKKRPGRSKKITV